MQDFRQVFRDFLNQISGLDTRINYLEAQEPLFHVRYVAIDNTDSPYSPQRETVILCDASGGAITINLPQISTDYGRVLFIVKIDASANAITIDGFGAETIGGNVTLDLTEQNQGIQIIAIGSYWAFLSEVISASGVLYDHDHSGDLGDGGTFDAANLTSGASTDGQVLTSDGLGGSAWEDASGGAGSIDTIMTDALGYVMIDANGNVMYGA